MHSGKVMNDQNKRTISFLTGGVNTMNSENKLSGELESWLASKELETATKLKDLDFGQHLDSGINCNQANYPTWSLPLTIESSWLLPTQYVGFFLNRTKYFICGLYNHA